MLRFYSIFLLLSFCVGAKPSTSDGQWIKLTTKHFEMYTTNSAADAAAVLQVFEQAHSFFLQSSLLQSSRTLNQKTDAPVKIIAFRSEAEYAPFRLNPGAFAYYLRNYKHDYIVMQDIAPQHYGAAIHEYTHSIVEHLGWKLPLWLNEGLAEVYSTLASQDGQAVVGRLPQGRIADLRTGHRLSLQTLLSIDRKSPYYQQPDRMRVFYAQSWALCHMLFLSPAYRMKFMPFVAAISAGKPAADCFREIYGKNIDELESEVNSYIDAPTPPTVFANVKATQIEGNAIVSSINLFNRDLMLADLLAAHPQTANEARYRLVELAQAKPENAEVRESLGYLAWQKGNEAEARLQFRQAFQNGSNNAVMLYQYASLVEATPQGEAAEGDSARAALSKALDLDPDYADARLQLALLDFRAGHYRLASDNLTNIKVVKPEQAYCYYSVLAYSSYRLGKIEEARTAAVAAQAYADSSEKEQRCQTMLAKLDSLHTATMR